MSDPVPTPEAPTLDLKDVMFILKTFKACKIPMTDLEQAYRTVAKVQVIYQFLAKRTPVQEP